MEKTPVVVVCDPYYLSAKTSDSPSRSPSPNRSLKGFNLFRVISQKIGKSIRASKEYKSTSSDDDEEDFSNSSVNGTPTSSKTVGQMRKDVECDCKFYYKSGQANGKKGFPRGDGVEKPKAQDHDYGSKCLKFSTPCRHQPPSSGSDTYSSNDDSSESNETEQKTKRSHSSSNESSASSSSSSADSFNNKQSNGTGCKTLKNLSLRSKSLSCFTISQMKEANERRESCSKEKRTKKSPQKILRPPAVHTYVRGISGLPTLKVINTRGCYNNQYSRG